ncbi:hypothetical protein M422DRAFT_242352, partial [Sphaerobolus stellatus SS14]
MTDLELPSYMLAWKTSVEVDRMEEVLVGDPRRTVLGFEADKKFDQPAPKFNFDDPFEEEDDRLSKVTRYWRARDQERTQRESRYRELFDAETAAEWRKRTAEAARKQREAEEEMAKEKEREQEKRKEQEKDKGKGKEKEAGPSGNSKGKAREVPKTPKKTTPKKSKRDVRSESEEEEEPEEPEE